ncbi:MAG: ATP phosphoribosyltransferase regulatory subunit [Gammaproteobacteria bacterium]|nr:ATP phosphoribosyltransferase regulatory subunit [Gammaproteobacteria bacterium]MDP2142039.1 ATP phosphoribosyltransferase regulatory subunit [Gammaproteobacteria bacterium]MDP2348382.1 ATP phosphoribosyltransferase regulatory subunit [Gammaproteobacteria bacterium]
MTASDRWLLPEGVEEILPAEAFRLESLRRQLLDLYAAWGYELVITPLIEYLDSLLVGSSHDLDLHTFKITDQLTGRMMGVRADITPQVARIDAHCLGRQGGVEQNAPVRLCYADNVLHTKPRGLLASRVPIRIGAELFGHAGVGADIELICLMHETLETAEISDVFIVLGHVGIFRSLVKAAQLSESSESELFDALQRKAYEDIDGLLDTHVDDDNIRTMLRDLSRLSGDESVLVEALATFNNAPSSVRKELSELAEIAAGVKKRLPSIELGFDLCELRGYEYHTGIVFAAYTPGYGRAVAQGGRYDDIGQVFGRARPASGFDSDLKVIARLSNKEFKRSKAVSAPCEEDAELAQMIAQLRASGERVIVDLDNEALPVKTLQSLGCDRRIIRQQDGWQIEILR